mmetsp:Transcript_10067/g.21792  ORF Transcript_10067/g.21792 Transcript_10067/m.21792 type:complete len:233 (-) Transcript_10067:52-750(-)
MSVANLTHMTMVNLNNKVGSRIMENPLELEEESLLTLVLLVLLTVEGGASPLVAPLVAPLMAVAPAATSLVSSDVLSFASIASSGSLVIRFTVVGHVLLTVVVVDDDDDDDDNDDELLEPWMVTRKHVGSFLKHREREDDGLLLLFAVISIVRVGDGNDEVLLPRGNFDDDNEGGVNATHPENNDDGNDDDARTNTANADDVAIISHSRSSLLEMKFDRFVAMATIRFRLCL